MLIQNEKINQLRDVGLNSYEAKLWLALLSKGVAAAGELSDTAGVPRSRSYDVLESLEKKGFIIMKIGKPIKYIAVQPEHVIENVRKRILEDAELQDKFLSRVEESPLIDELKAIYKSGVSEVDPLELTGSLKGRKNLYNHIERMIRSAEKTIMISTTTSGIIRKKDALKKELRKAKERKVKIRIIANVTDDVKAQLEELALFAEIRHSPTPARFCAVDSKEAVIMPLDDEITNPAADVGIVVKSKFFTGTFEKLFEANWPNLKPVFGRL